MWAMCMCSCIRLSILGDSDGFGSDSNKRETEKPQRERTIQRALTKIPCKKNNSNKKTTDRTSRQTQAGIGHSAPCNKPATTALPHAQRHCISNTATSNAPYSCPIMTSTLALQNQLQNTNPAHSKWPAHSSCTSDGFGPNACGHVAAAW